MRKLVTATATVVLASASTLVADTDAARHPGGCNSKKCLQRQPCQTHNCDIRVRHRQIAAGDRAWLRSTRGCESGGRYATNTGNGFYGAYQFTAQTWRAARRGISRVGLAHRASAREQDLAALQWRRMIGGRAHSAAGWPKCG